MSSSHANMSSETPAENEGSERRARRDRAGGVTRSYQSEHKALDDLAAEVGDVTSSLFPPPPRGIRVPIPAFLSTCCHSHHTPPGLTVRAHLCTPLTRCEQAEAALAARRKARADARAMRLQEKLKEVESVRCQGPLAFLLPPPCRPVVHAMPAVYLVNCPGCLAATFARAQAHSEARAQEDERGAAEAQAALEAVRKQVEEREARNRELVAEEEQRTVRAVAVASPLVPLHRSPLTGPPTSGALQGTAKDVLEATESLVAKVLETESGQEAVQKLVEQVNLLKNQFKDSMLHANRLHAHKAKAAFEMDKLRDRLEDLDEEALELRAALREKNDEIQGVSYQASSRASRVAELEAENNTLREQLGAGGGNGVSAPVMDGPGAQQLQLEKEALQAEVARLKERLAGASATEAEDEPDAPNPDDPGLDPLASARIRRLEAQVKRLKTSLATAEENEDNSRKALRTCQRDVRKLKDDKMELEVSLESAQSQLKRLRCVDPTATRNPTPPCPRRHRHTIVVTLLDHIVCPLPLPCAQGPQEASRRRHVASTLSNHPPGGPPRSVPLAAPYGRRTCGRGISQSGSLQQPYCWRSGRPSRTFLWLEKKRNYPALSPQACRHGAPPPPWRPPLGCEDKPLTGPCAGARGPEPRANRRG